VGTVDIVEMTEMGNVFGVAEEFTRYVAKNALSYLSCITH
jgi:hypothetical protein